MVLLKAKFLEATERPPSPPFTEPLRLVRVLAHDEVLNLLADEATFADLAGHDHLDDIVLQVALRRVDLSQLGGKGVAYRLRAVDGLAEVSI